MQPFDATTDVEQASREDEEVVRVLDAYLADVESGQPVDPNLLLAQHPAIAHRLRSCLAGLHLLDAGTAQLEPTTTELGDYRIVRPIGRGGMGVVYEAVHHSDGRRVALKVLPFAASLDPRQLQRFKNEAHAASHLHHPHIVPVYEVGCAGGTHFYTMQFIEGQSLSNLWRDQRRKVRESARLDDTYKIVGDTAAIAADVTRNGIFPLGDLRWNTMAYVRTVAEWIRQAAEALDHAHHVGVIHRDIKPGNLLLDQRGQLWITDFGLASVRGGDGLTATGDVLGTLRYMSPEQASARRGVVDHRTDIYSLGVTLYELITLRPAFEGQDREEVLSQMSWAEPRLPSRLNAAVSRDLETIVLATMAKAPHERYATAKALADDLSRFLTGELIHARRPGVLVQARNWAARHRSWVAAGGVFMLLAIVGLSISTVVVSRALVAEGVQRTLADSRQIESRRHLYAAQMNLALADWESGNVARVLDALERQRPAAGQEDLRGFEWSHLLRRCQVASQAILEGHKRPVRAVAASGNGAVWATAGDDGAICLWNPATHTLRQTIQLAGESAVSLAISADGRWLAAATSAGGVRLWDLINNSTSILRASDGGYEFAVEFSPDGATLVSSSGIVWDVVAHERRPRLLIPAQSPNSVAISADGFTVAGGGNDSQVLLWDIRSPATQPVQLGRHRTYIHCVAFSPDGQTLLTGSEDGIVKLWDMTDRRLMRSLRRHTGAVTGAAFSPDGQHVATVSWDGSVKLWNPISDEILLQQGHPGQVNAIAFTSDGKRLLSAGEEGAARVWDLTAPHEPLVVHGHKGAVRVVEFAADGQTIISAGSDSTVRSWDLAGEHNRVLLDNSQAFEPAWFAEQPQLAGGGKSHVSMSAVTTRENTVLAADFGGRVWLLNTSGPSDGIEMGEAGGPIWSLALSSDGKTLAAAGYRSNTVTLWDTATRKKRLTLAGHTDRVWTVAFAPDGRMIASGANDKTVRLWDVATGSQVRKIDVPAEWIYALAIAPDSRMLAVGAGDNRVRLYDIATGREQDSLGQHPATIRAAAFFPDGKTLATGGGDGTVKLWDLATHQERLTLSLPPLSPVATLADGAMTTDMPESSVWSIAIAPDGQALAAGDGDGRITIWRAEVKADGKSDASRP